MTTELLICVVVFPALFVYWFDYVTGFPADEKLNTGAIFFCYTYALSAWKLRRLGKLSGLMAQLDKSKREHKGDAMALSTARRSFYEFVVNTARPHFTWEKALGMCPVCFHFWITLISWLIYQKEKNIYFQVNIFYFENILLTFVLPYLLSHLIIRTLKKYI